MNKLEQAARQALGALEDMNNGWHYIRQTHGDLYGVGWDRAEGKAESSITALREALAEQTEQEPVAKFLEDNLVVENERVDKSGHRVLEIREEELLRIMEIYAVPVQQAEQDLDTCPGCGGVADNGHDREFPPNPYYCTKCSEQAERDLVEKEIAAAVLDHCYGYSAVNDDMIERTSVVVKKILDKHAASQPVQEPVKREHITDGSPCWCNPELNYKDPETGAEVWVHKEPVSTELYVSEFAEATPAAPIGTLIIPDATKMACTIHVPELAEQEPIGTYKDIANTMNSLWNGTSVQRQIAAELNNKLLYTRPVRTKDLTDDEICEAAGMDDVNAWFVQTSRAVIAADREKNK